MGCSGLGVRSEYCFGLFCHFRLSAVLKCTKGITTQGITRRWWHLQSDHEPHLIVHQHLSQKKCLTSFGHTGACRKLRIGGQTTNPAGLMSFRNVPKRGVASTAPCFCTGALKCVGLAARLSVGAGFLPAEVQTPIFQVAKTLGNSRGKSTSQNVLYTKNNVLPLPDNP